MFFQPDSNIVDDNERANMTIKIKMDKCTDFQDVNCIGSVTLTYQSAIIKLEGEKLFINHVDYSETIRKTPYSFNGLYVKEVTNKFRVVKAFGLKILYDKKRTLYIDRSETMEFAQSLIRPLTLRVNGAKITRDEYFPVYSNWSIPSSLVYLI